MINWFARNGVAANLLMAIIVFGGLASMYSIKVELFPQFSLDTIIVQVPFRGGAPGPPAHAAARPWAGARRN